MYFGRGNMGFDMNDFEEKMEKLGSRIFKFYYLIISLYILILISVFVLVWHGIIYLRGII